MKAQKAAQILAVLMVVLVSANALKCYVTDPEKPKEKGDKMDCIDDKKNKAAHGMCIKVAGEVDGEKGTYRDCLGWSEQYHETVKKCLTDLGVKSGECVDKVLIPVCYANAGTHTAIFNTSSIMNEIKADSKVSSCFCDNKDLCNGSTRTMISSGLLGAFLAVSVFIGKLLA